MKLKFKNEAWIDYYRAILSLYIQYVYVRLCQCAQRLIRKIENYYDNG